jgi:hypothetical protein
MNKLLNSEYLKEYKMFKERLDEMILKYEQRLPRYNSRRPDWMMIFVYAYYYEHEYQGMKITENS